MKTAKPKHIQVEELQKRDACGDKNQPSKQNNNKQ